MEYNSYLTECMLLRRSLGFLAEVVLPNKQKMMIRCPNLGPMLSCDILGTRVWYSNAVGYNCLPTWELAEVDEGHLVCVNPELVRPVAVEAIKKGIITELQDYNILHTTGGQSGQYYSQILLLEKDNLHCHVCLELVTLGDEKGEGYFPESIGGGLDNLDYLIRMKEEGDEAVLLFCAFNTGIECIKPASHINPDYAKKLEQAKEAGVKIISYRADISLQDISLRATLPVELDNRIKNDIDISTDINTKKFDIGSP